MIMFFLYFVVKYVNGHTPLVPLLREIQDVWLFFIYFYSMNENKLKYFALHKPYGFLSQFTDKLNRKTLSNLKNIPKDVYPVGRLDMDSEGLLLLSNDKLLVENKKTLPAKIEMVTPLNISERIPPIRKRINIPVCWLKIVITEGRNRQVRKTTAAIGNPTLRLIRTIIKSLSLGDLKSGEIRELTELEIVDLKK